MGEFAIHGANGPRQIGLGRGHIHIHHRGIHFHQKLAARHRLGIVGMKRHQGGVLAAGDDHDIPAHIGIVGALVKTGIEEPVGAIGEAGKDDHRAQNKEPAPAAGRIGAGNVAHCFSPWQSW